MAVWSLYILSPEAEGNMAHVADAPSRDEIMMFHKNLSPFLKDGTMLCVGEPMDFLSDEEMKEFLRKLDANDPEILADLD